MNAAATAGETDAHVARDRDPFGLQIGDEAAADLPRGILVDFAGIQAADVVRLENGRVDRR